MADSNVVYSFPAIAIVVIRGTGLVKNTYFYHAAFYS